MIDKIIDSIFDLASPALTRLRITIFLISLIFLSPKFDEIFNQSPIKISLSELWSTTINIVTSIEATSLAISFLTTFYLAPFAIKHTLMALIKFHISHAESLTKEISAFSKSNMVTFKDIVKHDFENIRTKKENAIATIESKKNACEVLLLMTLLYFFSSMKNDVINLVFLLIICTILLSSLFYNSRSILIMYLKDVAKYKILIQKIELAKADEKRNILSQYLEEENKQSN